MRAIIFVNGKIEEPALVQKLVRADDLLVAADGGALHCLAIRLVPHWVVGDLDSLTPEIIEQLLAQGSQIERHPPAKNETDLELAIKRTIAEGATEILLVGATGGRLDQTLANVLLLAQRTWEATLKVVDGNQIAQLLRSSESLTFENQVGTLLSILPLSPEVTGITYHGMVYPLTDATLQMGSTRGISNEIADLSAGVSIKDGVLLVVWEMGASSR